MCKCILRVDDCIIGAVDPRNGGEGIVGITGEHQAVDPIHVGRNKPA
jgi:hypothetical protein